jgi:hypothetical protein
MGKELEKFIEVLKYRRSISAEETSVEIESVDILKLSLALQTDLAHLQEQIDMLDQKGVLKK